MSAHVLYTHWSTCDWSHSSRAPPGKGAPRCVGGGDGRIHVAAGLSHGQASPGPGRGRQDAATRARPTDRADRLSDLCQQLGGRSPQVRYQMIARPQMSPPPPIFGPWSVPVFAMKKISEGVAPWPTPPLCIWYRPISDRDLALHASHRTAHFAVSHSSLPDNGGLTDPVHGRGRSQL